MAAGKAKSGRRSAGLRKYWCALGRRFHEIEAFDAIALTLVVDVMNLGRIGVHTAGGIIDYRTFVPRSFPQLVDHVDIFVSPGVPLLMRQVARQPDIAEGPFVG